MPLIHIPSSLGGFPFLPAAAAAFTCDAADFDGTNDWLNRGADFTGSADSSLGIFSGWVRIDGSDATYMGIVRHVSGQCNIERTSGDKFEVELWDPTNMVNVVRMRSTTSYTTSTTWLHFLASWSTNFTAGNKLTHLYINDVDDKNLLVDSVSGSDVDYTPTDWAVGARSAAGAGPFNGALAEIYFAPGQYLDFSVESNRRKFISATGKPVDLGADGSTPTGTAPILYCRMADGAAASTFGTNLGSGGGMTINGTLDIASTSPSD